MVGRSRSEDSVATDTSLLTEGVGLMCGSGDWLLLTTVLGVVVAESLSGVNTSSPFSCKKYISGFFFSKGDGSRTTKTVQRKRKAMNNEYMINTEI